MRLAFGYARVLGTRPKRKRGSVMRFIILYGYNTMEAGASGYVIALIPITLFTE